MIEWHAAGIPFTCTTCKKEIKPGQKVGFSVFKPYCWRCGTNLELAYSHRHEAQAIAHLRQI